MLALACERCGFVDFTRHRVLEEAAVRAQGGTAASDG